MHCISYYIESSPYLNTCIAYLNTLSRFHISLHWTDTTRLGSNLGSQSESSNTSPESSTYQNRVLRHPRALGYGWRTFSALGLSWLAIAYLNTLGSSTPPASSAHTLTLTTDKEMIPTQSQSHPSVCGFYTIFAAFHLFRLCWEDNTGVQNFIVLFYKYSYVLFNHFSCRFAVYTRYLCKYIFSELLF